MVLVLPLAVFRVILFVFLLIDILTLCFTFTAYYKYARLRLVQMADSLYPTNTFAGEQS